jgi:hypothetical protein
LASACEFDEQSDFILHFSFSGGFGAAIVAKIANPPSTRM